MKRKTNLANRANYGGVRSGAPIYIVLHYTANDGDSDEGNANFFRNNIVKTSAHYFVDDDSITLSVPEDHVAYAVGGAKLNTGGGQYYKKCTNTNSISIELCDTRRDGVLRPTDITINNAVELTRELMAKYKIPKERVIRHYDVTGKICPAYWIDNSKWEREFLSKLSLDLSVTYSYEFYRGAYKDLANAFKNDSGAYERHFRDHGINEGRQGSMVFDAITYTMKNKDLKNLSYMQAIEHFLAHGINEWRETAPGFSVKAYKENNPDLAKAYGDNCRAYYEHYAAHGYKENRRLI